MKVLITGANGFVGGHLLKKAEMLYGRKNILALTSKEIPGSNCVIYKNHDLVNLEESIFPEIDVLIHVGAFTPKNSLEANSISLCNSNINFTEKLLNLPFKNLNKIINISTLDVYESCELISEQTLINPQSLYGLSKHYCEKIVDIYAKQRGVKIQTLRLGHIYGSGEEKYQKILPVTIQNVIKNKPVEIWGDGKELRSFIYIDDVVSAIINAVELNLDVGPINVVGGHSISVEDLVKKIIAMSAKKIEIIYKESNHIKKNFVFDNQLLKKTLITEEINFDEGLRVEYQYMRDKLEHYI